ncbi:MAG: hypothetical protein KIT20_02295 [Alphaproteobacteria bacterium]|nr:hypothetical protein [Alphaproteobacteria bacterium]
MGEGGFVEGRMAYFPAHHPCLHCKRPRREAAANRPLRHDVRVGVVMKVATAVDLLQSLEGAGFSRVQAEAIASTAEKVIEMTAATKDDVAGLRGAIDRLSADVDQRFADMDRKFADMDRKFVDVDRRFADMDRRFAEIDGRFDKVDLRFDEIGKHLEMHDRRFLLVEGKIDLLAARIDTVFERQTKIFIGSVLTIAGLALGAARLIF